MARLNTTLDQYPIIDTQEAETQLIVPDNGTVMMGGIGDQKQSGHRHTAVVRSAFYREILQPYRA